MLTQHVDLKRRQPLSKKGNMSHLNKIDEFMESISLMNRVIFMRRYWFCETYAEIASRYGISERKVKRCIQETRKNMCYYLGRTWGSFGINHVNVKFLREAENVVSIRENRVFLRDFRSMLNDLINHLLGRFLSFPRHA